MPFEIRFAETAHIFAEWRVGTETLFGPIEISSALPLILTQTPRFLELD
jgi:hypothetical protein